MKTLKRKKRKEKSEALVEQRKQSCAKMGPIERGGREGNWREDEVLYRDSYLHFLLFTYLFGFGIFLEILTEKGVSETRLIEIYS